MVCLSAGQFAENLLENNGADVKRSKLEGRSGILTWKWTLEYLEREEIPTVPPPAPPPEEHMAEMRGQGVHAKALRIRAFWSEIGRTPGCPACESPGPGESHSRECRTYQDAWDESRRTASAEEAKRGIVGDPDTRPLDPSGSSTNPEPKGTQTTSVTDNENVADQMDVVAKTKMVICDPSYPAKTKVIGKVVRYTNSLGAPIPDLLNRDGKFRFWPDHHCTETTGTQEGHLRDDGVVGALCHFQGQVHHDREHRRRDSCNLPGIRVPKRMLGHCSTAERKGSDDAFDGTEELESAR